MPTEPNFTDEIFFHKEKEELILKPFCRVLPILKSDNLKRENSIKKCFQGVHWNHKSKVSFTVYTTCLRKYSEMEWLAGTRGLEVGMIKQETNVT